MKISTNGSSPKFSAKFINNNALKQVVKFADDSNQLQRLDSALNILKNSNSGDILIIHGKLPSGSVYSSFTMNKRSVVNRTAETPAQASFQGILELSELGRKFRSLFGTEAKISLTTDDIIKKYTV